MPSQEVVVNGTTSEEKKKEPIKLYQARTPLTPAQHFTRTASYAQDPKSYLEHKLGKDTLSKRENLLSIPSSSEEIDRDLYGTGNHKTKFQKHIASFFGKPAGLFFLTGIQAQLTACKIHCQKEGNNRTAWHVTSHLEQNEELSFEKLYGLERTLLPSQDEANPTLEEIKTILDLPREKRPAVLILELPSRTIGCKTYTFPEIEAISTACREAGVKFHLDGARIWEIEPYYQHSAGKTFKDIAALFDSVYVSFYKGLGGIAGAMLMGEETFIEEARTWQWRAGGRAVTCVYEVVDCERGFNENLGVFWGRWEKMVEVQRAVEEAVKNFETGGGERVVEFLAKEALCCQVVTLFRGFDEGDLEAARDKVEERMGVRIFDKVRKRKTVNEMFEEAKEAKDSKDKKEGADGKTHLYEREWMIGEESIKIETKVFVDAYVTLCEELLAARKEGKK